MSFPNFLLNLFYLFICKIYDVYTTAIDVYTVRYLKQHRVLTSDREGRFDPGIRRVAIFAIYPSLEVLPFIRNALLALKALGFHTIVVSTRRLDPAVHEEFLGLCARLIERPSVGRDFGSYQIGLRHLGGDDFQPPAACEEILLINDSMYYGGNSETVFKDVLSQPGDWLTMFENFQLQYHAQSFFLAFRPGVFRSAAFRSFWSRYIPYSSRRHAINKGEVGLTSRLKKAGFLPSALFNSVQLAGKLTEFTADNKVFPLLGYLSVSDTYECTELFYSRGRGSEIMDRAFVRWIIRHAEVRNPTHTAGLLLNLLAGAPLKRDVCYRRVFPIAQVIASATGYAPAELAMMHVDLRRKGLWDSLNPLQRALFTWGRI